MRGNSVTDGTHYPPWGDEYSRCILVDISNKSKGRNESPRM